MLSLITSILFSFDHLPMAQGLHQVQKQTQSMVLAPQLRQSLKILQVPAIELRSTILEELQTNPTLDELPHEGISLDAPASDESRADGESASSGEGELKFTEDFEIFNKLDEDWREYFAQENSNRVFSSEDAERRQHFFDSLVSETSLQEHLSGQADLSEMTKEEAQALQYIIGSLDKRGFLAQSLSDIALLSNLPLKAVQNAHQLLLSFEPRGVGCFDLQHCLLFQLEIRGLKGSLAYEIIRDHYKLLLRRRVPEIARKTSSSIHETQNAFELIATLDPSPVSRFTEDTNRVVVPDVTITKGDNGWEVHLNHELIPRLRISPAYKEMLAKGKMSPKERAYVQEKMRSGRFLMSSIEQRQQTIERISRQLLQFQMEFFEKGVSALRPLTMSQVAESVGVHETTVSRAIANKYVETPHGIFDFKFFFTPGLQSSNGETVSNKSVKEAIAFIIEGEDPSHPLSDQELVRILGEKEITIARRTVAKYREELGILPTNLRRRY
jgi:RNA polymerase sigma-54 factor